MPIAPRFHIAHIRDFAKQLARAPESVRLLQMDSVEQLLKEIDEETLYPLDYIVYRITGYRGDKLNQPMLLGSALIGDFVSLIAIVSRTMNLPANGMMGVKEASAILGVSLRTLSRLRREGLVFHWVVEKNGRFRLGCSQKMLDDFLSQNKCRIQKASQFSRLSQEEQKDIIQLALQYDGKKQTLSEVAADLAKQSNRGHETIRILLQRSDRTSNVFQKSDSLSRNDVREIERKIRHGTPWNELTKRYQRTAGALRKALLRLRATRLKQLDIPFVELEIFSRDDAEEVILGATAAQRVEPPVLNVDLLELNHSKVQLGNEETAVVSAMHLLRRRASLKINTLEYAPSEQIVDRIETDLRWSFLLQQQLILEAIPSSIAVAVQHAGRPLDELPENQIIPFMAQLIQIVGESCSSLNPSIGQTAAKTTALVLDRNLTFIDMKSNPKRAAAKNRSIVLNNPFNQTVPWTFLLPTHNLQLRAHATSSTVKDLVALRYGWNGKPRTVLEIGSKLDKTATWVARKLRSW